MFKELTILEPFFVDPSREYNIREVARLLSISPATASKKLALFEKEGVLKSREERMLILYKANVEGTTYKEVKKFFTLWSIHKSGLVEALDEHYYKPTIILFGSSSKGEDVQESDVDLLVISEVTKEFSDRKKFEKKLKRGIHLITVKSIKELKNNHLANNVLNGIVLQGHVEWN